MMNFYSLGCVWCHSLTLITELCVTDRSLISVQFGCQLSWMCRWRHFCFYMASFLGARHFLGPSLEFVWDSQSKPCESNAQFYLSAVSAPHLVGLFQLQYSFGNRTRGKACWYDEFIFSWLCLMPLAWPWLLRYAILIAFWTASGTFPYRIWCSFA